MKIWLLSPERMVLPSELLVLSAVATLSAGDPAQRVIAVAISSCDPKRT